MVPEDSSRFPLGEFSSSRINRLVSCRMYDKPAKTLPSIGSLIHLSPYEKRSRYLASSSTGHLPRQQLLRLKGIEEDSIKESSTDYDDLSNKLRVRLQFAYYKYKTNQMNQKFKDIRKHTQRRQLSLKKTRPSKRKLMVSHGNFKTPAKASYLISRQERATPEEASMGERLHFCEVPQDATTISATMTTTTTTITTTATPIGKVDKKFLQQETPMSVRAAKSLIHLFTSNRR